MKEKRIKVTLQQLADGDYRVVQMTNAITVHPFRAPAVAVGETIVPSQANILCEMRSIDVVVNAIKQ